MKHTDIMMKYRLEFGLVTNIFDWLENRTTFISNLKHLQEDTLRAYVILLGYYWSKNEISDKILVFTSDDLSKIIEGSTDVLANHTNTTTYLIDIAEILLKIGESGQFVEKCEKQLIDAVHSQNENAIDVYFRVAAHFNIALPNGIPFGMQTAVIKSMHSRSSNNKLFAEALLLIDVALQKQQQEDKECDVVTDSLKCIWNELCVRRDHECDQCYAILAQFIDYFLNCCRANDVFAKDFLSDELWTILRRGMMSKEVLKRKQSNYVLRSVLKFVTYRSEYSEIFGFGTQADHCASVWDTYFIVLDTMLDFQGHLIVSTLEQYFGNIVQSLPDKWLGIIFGMVFSHSVTSVKQYGISFTLRHKIHFDNQSDINDMFHMALNNMAVYTERSTEFVEKMAEYICTKNNINHEVEMMARINWKSVPGWIMLNSLTVSLKKNPSVGGINVSAVMAFIEAIVQTKNIRETVEINGMIVDMVLTIGSNQFSLIQLLTLYEKTQCAKLLEEIPQRLTIDTFEWELIPSTKVSPATKVDYFKFALTDANDQSDFLDRFYERTKGEQEITGLSDFEYILFSSMCIEHGLLNALHLFKSRLYDLISRNDNVNVDSLMFAVDLMSFIATRYLPMAEESAEIYKCFDETFNSFHQIIRNKMYVGRNATNESILRQRVDLIAAKLATCSELHPSRMDVLAIFSNAVIIEDYNLDLHRFSHSNAEDTQLIQNLLDWFILSVAKSMKPAHRAKVISAMLKSFPNLQYDVCEIFSMLLAGKCCVKCIFDSTQPSCIEAFDTLLMDALLYGPEYKGDERIEYRFSAENSNGPTYVQQVRLTAMQVIRRNNSIKQIRNLKNMLFAKRDEFYTARYFNKSHQHSLKLRFTQALAFLFHLDPLWDHRTLDFILLEANQTNVKFICELIVADIMDPERIFAIIKSIEGNRGIVSLFQVMNYVCYKHNDRNFAIECIDFLANYLFVKQISVRSAAQLSLVKLCEKFNLCESYKLICDSLRSAMLVNSVPKSAKILHLSDLRSEYIDCQNFLHPFYVFHEIPRLTEMNTDEYYKNCVLFDHGDEKEITKIPLSTFSTELLDVRNSDITFIEKMDDISFEFGSHTQNVQKKMIPYREHFIDRELLNSLPADFHHESKSIDSDLIVIGSLISKIPNLGGICRSSEVFGVSAIGIDNLQSIKRSEFTSLSMASEKWLNFIEIKSHNLFSYLSAMKSKGYCIVGAEQTASGKYLHNTVLPHKMILVLGHEKEGIPAKIINLLDLAIEIPQLGVVRSLNVHVTAALFTWEYCKQHLLSSVHKF